MMMVDDREFLAGTHTAILNLISILVDDLARSHGYDPSSLVERVTKLAEGVEAAPDRDHLGRDAVVAHQLRAFLQLLAYDGKRPLWQPTVIQGGYPEEEG